MIRPRKALKIENLMSKDLKIEKASALRIQIASQEGRIPKEQANELIRKVNAKIIAAGLPHGSQLVLVA